MLRYRGSLFFNTGRLLSQAAPDGFHPTPTPSVIPGLPNGVKVGGHLDLGKSLLERFFCLLAFSSGFSLLSPMGLPAVEPFADRLLPKGLAA